MASHHHHYHHSCHQTTATVTTPCCCCCYSACCTPPPPDPLQPVAPHFRHAPPQPYLYSSDLSPPHDPQSFHHRPIPYPPPPTHPQRQEEFQQHPHHYPQQQQRRQQTQPVVSSLLRRIAALESSLRHQFSASSYSVCDAAAARTIQTHFRAFLVRRSRTLRQLKDLASIKSTLNALKASVSDNAYLDSQALSRRAMDLLLRLDSIEGADPMIRDGKRSISRDLIRFLDFIDGLYVKRNKLSSIGLKNVRFGATGNKSRVLHSDQKIGSAEFLVSARDERELMEQLRSRVQKIRVCSAVPEDDDEKGIELENPRISINGVVGPPHNRNVVLAKPRVKKTVSFANNGNVSRVFITTHEPNSSEDVNSSDGGGSIGDDRELVDNLCREVKEIGGFSKGGGDEEAACTEDGETPRISCRERKSGRNLRAEDSYEIRGHYQGGFLKNQQNLEVLRQLPTREEIESLLRLLHSEPKKVEQETAQLAKTLTVEVQNLNSKLASVERTIQELEQYIKYYIR